MRPEQGEAVLAGFDIGFDDPALRAELGLGPPSDTVDLGHGVRVNIDALPSPLVLPLHQAIPRSVQPLYKQIVTENPPDYILVHGATVNGTISDRETTTFTSPIAFIDWCTSNSGLPVFVTTSSHSSAFDPNGHASLNLANQHYGLHEALINAGGVLLQRGNTEDAYVACALMRACLAHPDSKPDMVMAAVRELNQPSFNQALVNLGSPWVTAT